MTGGWITDASVALARELWDQGVAAEKIGQRFGASKNAVLGLAHRRDWPRRPSPIPVNGVFETGILVRKRPPKRQPVPPLPSLEAVDAVAPEPVPEAPVVPAWLSLPVPPARSCQWPSTPWRRPWPLCGAAVDGAGPYCCEHAALAYAGIARRVAA